MCIPCLSACVSSLAVAIGLFAGGVVLAFAIGLAVPVVLVGIVAFGVVTVAGFLTDVAAEKAASGNLWVPLIL